LQLVKKFPAFHGTRRFITALTSVRHLSLSWASPIQSIYPHPTSWRSILILSTHLRLGLPSGLLPSGFPSMTLHTPLSSPIRATCPAHLIFRDCIPSINPHYSKLYYIYEFHNLHYILLLIPIIIWIKYTNFLIYCRHYVCDIIAHLNLRYLKYIKYNLKARNGVVTV